MAVPDRKRMLRAAARERRRRLRAEHPHAGERATGHLLRYLVDRPDGEVVAGYLPLPDEFDPLPAMQALLRLGRRLCVPVGVNPGTPLRFRAWTPGTPTVRGRFGVEEPVRGENLWPRTLIVPLLAFDRRGHRLGYGGGFYDRTLAELRAAGTVCAVGLAFAAQEVDEVPREETDAPLDAVVTEDGVVAPCRA